jgi:hypothetical protein
MRVMMKLSNINLKKFSMGNNEDNNLWDNQEDIHHEDNKEDLNNKDIKVISKVIKITKVIHCSRTLIKVTRGEINNEATLEASQTSEDIKIDLEIHWIPATMP